MKMSLKACRINAELTQKQAAKMIGISESTLFNYEKGKTFPDHNVVKKITEVYGIHYDNIRFL